MATRSEKVIGDLFPCFAKSFISRSRLTEITQEAAAVVRKAKPEAVLGLTEQHCIRTGSW